MNGVFRSLLVNRNFALLWCAYGISALGDHLSEWAVLGIVGALEPGVDISPLLARITLVFMLPFFLLGPLTGALADRLPRRAIMIAADLVRGAIMLSFIPLIAWSRATFGEAWGPFLPLGMVGVLAATFSPARQAIVPTLVPGEQLMSANALIGGLGMIATLIAALVGGQLAEHRLFREAFLLDACTFALSAVLVFKIATPPTTSHPTSARREPFLSALRAGTRYLAGHRRAAQIIGIAVVFWMCGATIRSVSPAIVKNVYQGSFSSIGVFQALGGVGMAAGAVLFTVLGRSLRSELAITWSLIGAGGAVLGLAGTALLSPLPRLAHGVGCVAVVVLGLFAAGIAAGYNTLLQRIVPNSYRGRISGLLDVGSIGGLLVATSLLAIPHWRGLDRWAGLILLVVAVLFGSLGLATLLHRLGRAPFSAAYAFWRNVTEVVVRWRCGMHRVGYCTIPRSGPVIVTANHGSYIDPLLILGACNYRRARFMIAAEYYDRPLIRYFVRVGGTIPVRRGANDIGATKAVIQYLRDGDAVGVFIQGGIRHRESDAALKNGVALMALRTGATVVPVHLSGTKHFESVGQTLFSRQNARVAFGKPLDLAEFAGQKGGDVLDRVTEKIYAAIQALAPTA